MSMDVIGKSPASEQGRCFSSNVWWWHPLWLYCREIAPDLIPADNSGHSNDSWGLDEHAARVLADHLAGALASGETQGFEEGYRATSKRFLSNRARPAAAPATVPNRPTAAPVCGIATDVTAAERFRTSPRITRSSSRTSANSRHSCGIAVDSESAESRQNPARSPTAFCWRTLPQGLALAGPASKDCRSKGWGKGKGQGKGLKGKGPVSKG
jgi:hypothetical protein